MRDLVDNSGPVIDHVDYGVFGNVVSESSPSNGDGFKYAGMRADAVAGLYYDQARWYDPASGRFVSVDPMGFESGDLYLLRYVDNFANGAIDPSGLETENPAEDPGGKIFISIEFGGHTTTIQVGVGYSGPMLPGGADVNIGVLYEDGEWNLGQDITGSEVNLLPRGDKYKIPELKPLLIFCPRTPLRPVNFTSPSSIPENPPWRYKSPFPPSVTLFPLSIIVYPCP